MGGRYDLTDLEGSVKLTKISEGGAVFVVNQRGGGKIFQRDTNGLEQSGSFAGDTAAGCVLAKFGQSGAHRIFCYGTGQ